MTLYEFLRILRAAIRAVVIVPLACAVLAGVGALLLITPTYQASSKLLTNISISVATGFADAAAATASTDAMSVGASTSTESATITFTATGGDAQACIDAVNEAADSTQDQIESGYAGTKATAAPIVVVRHTSRATGTTRSPLTYAAIGLCAGLAAVVVVVIIRDGRTRRIHDAASVERRADLPCLGTLGGDETQRENLALALLLAGAAHGRKADEICLVPVGAAHVGPAAVRRLEGTAVARGHAKAMPRIVVATSPSVDARVLLDRDHSRRFIPAVEEEKSTYDDLGDVLGRLAAAGIHPVGFVRVVPEASAGSASAQ